MNQKGFSALIFLPIILTVLIIGAVGWVLFNKPQQDLQTTPGPNPTSSALPSVTPAPSVIENVYHNKQLGFEFNLEPGERVASCPEEGEISDSYIFQATTLPKPESYEPEGLCGASDVTPEDAIFVSKTGTAYWGSSTQDYIDSLEADYQLTQTPTRISGVNAVKLQGDVMHLAPLPDSVNKVVFEYQGYFFEVDAIYLERNFRLTTP